MKVIVSVQKQKTNVIRISQSAKSASTLNHYPEF